MSNNTYLLSSAFRTPLLTKVTTERFQFIIAGVLPPLQAVTFVAVSQINGVATRGGREGGTSSRILAQMKQISASVEPPQTKHVAVACLQFEGVSGGRRGGRQASIGVGEDFDLGIRAIIEALVAVGRRAGTNLDERTRRRPRGGIPAIVGTIEVFDEKILVVVYDPPLIGGAGIAKVQLYIRRRTARPTSAPVGVGLEP